MFCQASLASITEMACAYDCLNLQNWLAWSVPSRLATSHGFTAVLSKLYKFLFEIIIVADVCDYHLGSPELHVLVEIIIQQFWLNIIKSIYVHQAHICSISFTFKIYKAYKSTKLCHYPDKH